MVCSRSEEQVSWPQGTWRVALAEVRPRCHIPQFGEQPVVCVSVGSGLTTLHCGLYCGLFGQAHNADKATSAPLKCTLFTLISTTLFNLVVQDIIISVCVCVNGFCICKSMMECLQI